jgi:hypothetical protein
MCSCARTNYSPIIESEHAYITDDLITINYTLILDKYMRTFTVADYCNATFYSIINIKVNKVKGQKVVTKEINGVNYILGVYTKNEVFFDLNLFKEVYKLDYPDENRIGEKIINKA